MDEQRLSQAFRDAVEGLPPASFGRDDVVAASRRATTRRRGMLAGATLLGVAVLAGGLMADGLVTGDADLPTAADAVLAPGSRGADPGTLSTLDAPSCGPIDAELAADLTAVLADRGSSISGPARAAPEPCPAGSRAAAVPVPGGVLSVLLVEPAPAQPPGPDGARVASVTLADGRTLAVISMPGTPGQPAPLADELSDLARGLAGAL